MKKFFTALLAGIVSLTAIFTAGCSIGDALDINGNSALVVSSVGDLSDDVVVYDKTDFNRTPKSDDKFSGTAEYDGKLYYCTMLVQRVGNVTVTCKVIDAYQLSGLDGRDGADGQDGAPGERGPAGPAGANGADGKDGADGQDGAPGERGPAGPAGANGTNGTNGADGKDGKDGKDGANGKSAYEIWLELGNAGSEADFIASLQASGSGGSVELYRHYINLTFGPGAVLGGLAYQVIITAITSSATAMDIVAVGEYLNSYIDAGRNRYYYVDGFMRNYEEDGEDPPMKPIFYINKFDLEWNEYMSIWNLTLGVDGQIFNFEMEGFYGLTDTVNTI